MKALVFADRSGKELLPLTDNICVALLPVAGKAVLEHTLEALAAASVHELLLVISAFADQVRSLVGDGGRWGLRVEYLLSRGEAAPDLFSQRLTDTLGGECLVLRGDVMRSPVIGAFLEQVRVTTAPTIYGLIAGENGAMAYCRQGPQTLAGLAWPLPDTLPAALPNTVAQVSLASAAGSRLESWAAYHRANLDAAAGRIPGLRLPGRQIALGLTVGRNSKLSPRSLKQGIALIGNDCQIHPQASLLGEVVIADQVIVDRYARLRSSVVLPNTYIGELLDVRNAIVRSNDLIRVDIGAVLHVTDACLLADFQSETLSASLAIPLNRLLGVLLLLLSLPLWPLAAIAALWRQPGKPLRAQRLRGNRSTAGELGLPGRREFVAWEWATTVPVLRYLPRLWNVVTGDLRVVGVVPLTPEQADSRGEEWERLAETAPAGLIGPTQLQIPEDAPMEERLLSDAFYAKHRSVYQDLRHLGQGVRLLFSRRAWSSTG